jgi:phage terminase large subunit-like protein
LVTWTLQTVEPTAPVQLVTASKGKRTRAEPVAALYEQGRVHHVGRFPELEDQLCLWDATAGGLSPDRLDALVWAVSALAVVGGPPLALINSDVGPSSITSRGSFDLIWGALRRRS